MVDISRDCIKEALGGLKNFTHDELEDYVREVFNRARSYEDLPNGVGLQKAIDEVNNDKLKSLFEDTTIKANNVMKFERNADLIRKGKVDVRGLLAARGKYLGENISNAQKEELERMYNYVLGDFSNAEVSQFTSGDLDQEICDAHDGKLIENPLSKKFANKLKDYFTYRNAQLILSNAMKFDEINEDRLFRAIHDQQKIISGASSLRNIAVDRVRRKYDPAKNKAKWRNYIKQFLDMDKTFAHTEAVDIQGKIDDARVDKILNRIFDNITTGKSNIFTRSVVANDREAVARKSKMFFKWKSLRAQYEYNKTFGRGNLFGMLMSDVQATANKVGMSKLWGDNPYSMLNDLRHVQEELGSKGALWWRNTDNYFKSVMGIDKATISPTSTYFLSNLRTVATMARLPLITVDSVPDIGYIASFAQRMGINYFRAWGNLLKNIFDLIPNEERKRVAKLFKTQVDSHLGFMGRWTDVNSANDLLSKISTGFFKVNMLHAFDRGNKVSIMHMMAKHLYDNSKKSFADLNPSLQRWVGKFLNEDEWNLLRSKNQNGLFTTENVDNLTDDELRAHYQTTDQKTPLSDLRSDLNRKVYSMFVVASENAVLTPTEFEKAFLWQGQAPGSALGEVLRMVSHFKMYALAYIDRVLVKGFQEADTATQKIFWATSMLIGTLPLAYMSTFFHNLFQGLSMPDYDMMNVPEREKYLVSLLAPSLAIFSGLLDPKNQNSSMVWSLLGSPSTSLISNAMAAPLALAAGDPARAAKKLKQAANYIFPIQTTPGISPLIRQAMGDEGYVEPGQQHYFGQ